MNKLTPYCLYLMVATLIIQCKPSQQVAKNTIQKEIVELTKQLPHTEPIPVLFIGSYHMHNPGADEFNLEADDVLVQKRQDEIQEVVDLLKQFNPTKIAIEASRDDSLTLARYSAYKNDKQELGKSEREQIGFRLAKLLNHKNIYPIDVKMQLNSSNLSNLVESDPQQFGPYLSSLDIVGNGAMDILGKWLSNGTIRDVLYKMNDPKFEKLAHELYFRSFLPVIKDDNYAGPDMVTTWYQRNLRIFSNLHQISSPGDRILVIYGQGHIPLLKQFTQDSPYFECMDTQKYLRPK